MELYKPSSDNVEDAVNGLRKIPDNDSETYTVNLKKNVSLKSKEVKTTYYLETQEQVDELKRLWEHSLPQSDLDAIEVGCKLLVTNYIDYD